jgi:mono/diheme cytochrome c family protein
MNLPAATLAIRARRSRPRAIGWTLVLACLGVACTHPLPDADSPGGRVYALECGVCHVPYAPGLLTPAMWEIQVARMDEYRRRRGMPPLDPAARRAILDYLRSHAE